ncbi:MAG: GIY-YIG nuclease family protein [Alphaproteobacteria bacterium]|nr:GIY-YIG nuclease family protein [Alphaproteobacteria bacterium]
MNRDEKKAAAAAWKERKAPAGVYALRCTASGQCWVGRATDLDAIEKRLMFSVRMASTPHRTLLAAARAHGGEAFAFERLELFEDEDAGPELRDALLKKRAEFWREELGAQAL